MLFKLTPISLAIFLTAFVNLFVAYSSWQRRKTKGGVYFALAMIAATFWTVCAGLDYAAVPIALKVFFAKLEYLGYCSAVALFAAFSLSYAGYEDWLKKPWMQLLLIGIPVSNILLAWTNELHGLIWADFRPSEIADNVLVFEHGPAFAWTVLSGYALLLIIFLSLLSATLKGPELARKQARLLLGALLVLVASNLICLFDTFNIPGVDWSSIAFSIVGLLFLYALYGSRFMDIVPIARNAMIERMVDGVLVLDTQGRLVDFNPAAQVVFALKQADLWMPLQTALARWAEIIALLENPDRPQTTEIATGNPARIFDLRLTPLIDNRNQEYGLLVVMRDVTERKQAESQREATLTALAQLSAELGERVKELNCLYGLSDLVEASGESIETLLQNAAELLPHAWQYPANACARVTLDGQTFSTSNFQHTPWMQQRPIFVEGVSAGSVMVAYLKAQANGNEEPFLPQEGRLLEAIAERLGRAVERIRVRQALHASEERYQNFIAQSFEAISRTEFDVPIDITLPIETQIDLIYENAYMAECNQALADMYHRPSPQALVGARLFDVHGGKDNPVNRATFRKFIENGYKSSGDETIETTADGEPVWFLSNTIGTIEGGRLVRLWGTALDITARKLTEEAVLKVAAFEERQRMARDLHDSVNQSIHSLVLFSETLTAVLDKQQFERAGQIAERLQESARQALKETRLLLYQIRSPLVSSGVELVQNLEARLMTVERRAGMQAHILPEGALDDCPPAWAESLFWIVIEALNNSLKHAQAHTLEITIRCLPQSLDLEVVDDGRGFDPASVHSGGMGLNNMQHRAGLIGGKLDIVSAPQHGCRVHFHGEIIDQP